MKLYGSAVDILGEAHDILKDGLKKIENGLNHVKGLDWDEILETLPSEEKDAVMRLINQGLDEIEDGLYDIND
ncbi:hypothetical protein Kirov_103 [Bacillus phage Kirov]|uniref:Uncharacterized protein n=1 Tax=Bacillus phage Kirov TaxID=2783539 RepID=A0A7U3RWI7_9CAUD|nr:hypothetical protein PQE67_gp201 [Bacillus phage Kirov]QOV08302.1 hypothetical protein Kirov_103 [Bacillus phage Kirov]